MKKYILLLAAAAFAFCPLVVTTASAHGVRGYKGHHHGGHHHARAAHHGVRHHRAA